MSLNTFLVHTERPQTEGSFLFLGVLTFVLASRHAGHPANYRAVRPTITKHESSEQTIEA
jgi:hypothetical protein